MADNVQLARGVFEELFSKGKLDFIDRNYDAAFKGHETLNQNYGRDELERSGELFPRGAARRGEGAEEAVAAGEKVLRGGACKATHRDGFLGRPAPGTPANVHGVPVV